MESMFLPNTRPQTTSAVEDSDSLSTKHRELSCSQRRPTTPLSHPSLLLVYVALAVLTLTASCTAQETYQPSPDSSQTLKVNSGAEAALELIKRYASDSSIGEGNNASTQGLSESEFEDLLMASSQHSKGYIRSLFGPCQQDEEEEEKEDGKVKEEKEDGDEEKEADHVIACPWKAECPGTLEIFDRYAQGEKLYADGLVKALPIALNTLTESSCASKAQAHETLYHSARSKRPSTMQTWLYGTLFCSLVVLISNIGGFLAPCMETKLFKRLLQFLVSMGAGSLASTGLLVLIPEAFDIMSVEELGDAYIWKATVAILSIFTFFCSERVLKTFLYNKKTRRSKDGFDGSDALNDHHALAETEQLNGGRQVEGRGNKMSEGADRSHSHSHSLVASPSSSRSSSSSSGEEEDRATLAWMVMSGDVIHNFVDGLSVGAAFTENVGLGISVSLAILCEELPHELADVAILLHSGLSMKKAIFINFLSACVVYLGLILGIVLGTNIHAANKWIFAMAGGLFLYVPLVDMLPDMSSHLDKLLAAGSGEAKVVAVLHLIGLLVGAAIIICIVNVTGFIVVD